jgi:uncharacterized membrane protein
MRKRIKVPHWTHHARNSWARTALKTAGYRGFTAIETTATAYIILQSGLFSWESATAIAVFSLANQVTNTVVYVAWERMWAHIDLVAHRIGRRGEHQRIRRNRRKTRKG